MAYNQNKVDVLKLKLESINKKIKSLTSQKKDLEKQIKDIEEREFINIIRKNGCTVPTLTDDLALAQLLRENNLTQNDVMELINDLGGLKNENEEN